jgi:Zn-dependent protease
MTQQFKIATIFGRELRVHWSWPLFPIAIAVYSLATHAWQQAVFFVAVLLGTYLIVLIHEAALCLVERPLGVNIRGATLYPFWSVNCCAQVSDRPSQEENLAKVSLVVRAFTVVAIGSGITLAGGRVTYPQSASTVDSFILYQFWAAALLLVLHLLPLLPLDGGQWLRAILAQRTSRLRATEIVAVVSTVGVGVAIFVAIVWTSSPFLAFVALLVFLAAQHELGVTRHFEKFRTNLDRPAKSPSMIVPMTDIVTPDCRPSEPDFSGFTWSARARLWIEWQNGRPVAANAVLGDGTP